MGYHPSGMKTTSTLAQVRPRDHQRYRDIPIFGRFLDDFVPWAFGRGYTIHTVYLQLDSVRHLSAWFQKNVRRSIRALRAEEFTAAHRYFTKRRRDWRFGWGLLAFIAFLEARGFLKPIRPKPPSRLEREVMLFLDYLRKDRGVAESTCDAYRRHVRHFLKFLKIGSHKYTLKTLTLATVHRYLRSVSVRYHRKQMQHITGSLRGFLRFEYMRGVLNRPLHTQIDSVRTYQDEHLPYPVQWVELQQLLRRIDRSTPLGSRDYAVLLIALTYGMRASDVASLTLDDVDWRKRTIHIVQCKTRQPLSLPLTDQVGAALTDYLQHSRPASSFRQIFLRRLAPIAPLSLPGMSHTLRRVSQTTGVALKAAGFRCLRHALALRLLRQGASAKDIGDIFGHRNTTSISTYLRLDVDDLRQVALPIPRQIHNDAPPKTPLPALSACRRGRGRTAPPGWNWRSFLKKPLTDYLSIQRALGRNYITEERTLRGLDFFLVRRYPLARRFTPAMFAAWATGLHPLSPTTARMRMLCVRNFCLHLARSRNGIFIPDPSTFPKELPHQAPYLISESEVARVLSATTTLRFTRSNPLHPQTIRMAFLLTYCCGLRSGETRKLRIADIDPESMMLRINETKFCKSRLVPLSQSVADDLRAYFEERSRMNLPMTPDAPLVWNGWPARNGRFQSLSNYPFWATWLRVCRRAHVLDHRGRSPRIHDLRHGFAVEALRRGYDAGMSPQAVLPRLARYMGHAGAQFTHYYLKFTEPLRCAASDRFRQYLAAACALPSADHQEGGMP